MVDECRPEVVALSAVSIAVSRRDAEWLTLPSSRCVKHCLGYWETRRFRDRAAGGRAAGYCGARVMAKR